MHSLNSGILNACEGHLVYYSDDILRKEITSSMQAVSVGDCWNLGYNITAGH